MILKAFHSYAATQDTNPSYSIHPHSVYDDLTACTFCLDGDGSAWARVWQREPIKTAQVPGFVENERVIQLDGPAYLMNDAGKTVSSFAPGPKGGMPQTMAA